MALAHAMATAIAPLLTNVRYYTEQLVTVPEVRTEAVLLTGNSHRSSTTYPVIRSEVALRTRISHRRATASHRSRPELLADSVHSAHLLPQSLPNSGRIRLTTFQRALWKVQAAVWRELGESTLYSQNTVRTTPRICQVFFASSHRVVCVSGQNPRIFATFT